MSRGKLQLTPPIQSRPLLAGGGLVVSSVSAPPAGQRAAGASGSGPSAGLLGVLISECELLKPAGMGWPVLGEGDPSRVLLDHGAPPLPCGEAPQ